jgi:GTP cyclohydrolase I
MKFQDLLKDEIDSLADDHIGSSIDNPIKKDAFKVSNTEKIKLIQEKVHDILDILGMDLKDDSLKGNP